MKDKIIERVKGLNRPLSEQKRALIGFLESSDFFRAPASGGSDKHLCEAGGLAKHSWNVYKALEGIVGKYVPGATPDSVAICGLFHDLCKTNFYKNDFRNVKNERGQWERVPYYSIDDKEPLGHGEKSVILLQMHLPLTLDEALAIRWHMGAWAAHSYQDQQALNAAVNRCALLRALMLADQVAAYFMERP